jgi:RimJ/RimL family protein N-acetyltransferase
VELLRTPRLLLRQWEESDLPAFFDIYSREEVARWLGPQPRRALASPEEARERLLRWHAREDGLDRPLGLWAIVPLAAATPAATPAGPVGTALLLPLTDASGPTGVTEIGWHLHPRHQGQGLATESASALLAAARDTGLDQILALTDPDNVPSQAVATRIGLHDDGLTDRWFGLTLRQFRHLP